MSSDAFRAPHFPTYEAQKRAAQLGMWLFLGTEVLLFGGLFVLYACYRYLYPRAFAAGSHELSLTAGTVNTVVLILSSFLVAVSLHSLQRDGRRFAALCLAGALVLGAIFLCIKGAEWREHFRQGSLPGRFYSGESQFEGINLFFALYFLMSGLHGLHVIAGMIVLAFVSGKILRRRVTSAHDTPLELAAMYWHLVDIVWIFLYPLLYLVK